MELKLLEWNIHKMTNNISVKQFVIDMLISMEADVICLVEYIDDKGIETAIQKKGYYFAVSNTISGNKVLIAVRNELAPNGIIVVNANEEKNCYNFLHIRVLMKNGEPLSIIGVRMLSPMDANKQSPPLDIYLSGLEEPFLCTGDFNIRHSRMNTWFKNFSIENITNTKLPLWNVSIIYTDKNNIVNDFGDVDHIIYGKGVNILSSAYDWTFLSCDKSVYPNVAKIGMGTIWNIPAAYPDHALMISNVEVP